MPGNPGEGRGSLALLPNDRPFTTAMAVSRGVTRQVLSRAVMAGLLVSPIRGVFHMPQLVDDLPLRLKMLSLVVPSTCVVTDRSAAWLWGATTALAPNDHVHTPRVSVFSPPGHRLRNGLVSSGERRLLAGDIATVDGVRVTTPLRTACDLGRLLSRDQALAAMDALAAEGGFVVDDLLLAVDRYRGYRGVIQLRALSSYVDPRAQSPGESILRLRWLDAGLPRPVCQVPVPAPTGGRYWLDMGLPGLRLAAEYDGAEFHTPADQDRDERRRAWIRDELGWTVVVVRRENLFGRAQDVDFQLRDAARQAMTAPKCR